MINNLIGMGAMLAGLAIAKKASVNFIEETKFVNGINGLISDSMYEFISRYEGYRSNAYDAGDGRYTIGYGQTNWLNTNGTVLRAVRKGDSIDEKTARIQIELYFVSAKKVVDNAILRTGVSIADRVYQMLLQVQYGSWSFPNTVGYTKMLNLLHMNTNMDLCANIVRDYTIAYYKTLTFGKNDNIPCSLGRSTKKKYDCYGLGWSRRIYGLTEFIKGNLITKLEADMSLKKAY